MISTPFFIFPRFRFRDFPCFPAAALPWLLALGALLLGPAACSSDPGGPVSALHHFKKGNEAFAIEDFGRAIRHYEMALELDENTAEIHYNLGLAFFRTDNFKEAAGAFQGALRVNSEMSDAHYNLALAYDRLYQPDAAHAHFNIYRKMISGRDKNKGKSSGAIAGSSAGASAKKSSAPPQGRLVRGPAKPPARRGPAAGSAMGRHAPPVPRPAGKNIPQTGDPNKWWTQDRFNRTR